MNQIEFTNVVQFARFCAQLMREGVRFIAHERSNGEFLITLTGGF